ncbi:SPFH domain-containing protein [Actinoplanes sp. CA-252034]|uniref:SPFH domain-containing protein n=1 Tax=Actinoplanes sp. CA-252034 TaxID=3239906 RepID=UPI003D9586DB
MWSLWIALTILVLLTLAFLAVKVVKQYEQGVLFRLGKVIAVRKAGLTVIIPFVDVLNRVSLRIVTMPIQLRNRQTFVELGVDKNSTVVFPAPPMSTIGEFGTFLARENAAAATTAPAATPSVNGTPMTPIAR